MMYPYCDLHTHSDRSDGRLSMQGLVNEARRNGVGVLAITDHNRVSDLTALRRDNPGLILIQGVEASTMYTDSTGKGHQPHIVGLGFEAFHPAMVELMRLCNPDRRPYNEEQLEALNKRGLYLGTYQEMLERWADRDQLGTRQFGEDLVRFGYCDSVRQAYDLHLGKGGDAYVPNRLHYPTVEEAVRGILAAGGIPVEAHLYYYGMDNRDNHLFTGMFHELAGDLGAIETEYGGYSRLQRDALRIEFALPYGLMESCASDYHGVGLDESDTLGHGFHREQVAPLLEKLGVPIF